MNNPGVLPLGLYPASSSQRMRTSLATLPRESIHAFVHRSVYISVNFIFVEFVLLVDVFGDDVGGDA